MSRSRAASVCPAVASMSYSRITSSSLLPIRFSRLRYTCRASSTFFCWARVLARPLLPTALETLTTEGSEEDQLAEAVRFWVLPSL